MGTVVDSRESWRQRILLGFRTRRISRSAGFAVTEKEEGGVEEEAMGKISFRMLCEFLFVSYQIAREATHFSGRDQ